MGNDRCLCDKHADRKSDKGTNCVSQINVLVVDISSDVLAELIADAVLKSSDMHLVRSRKDPTDPRDPKGLFVAQEEVEHVLKSLPAADRCAVVAVMHAPRCAEVTRHLVTSR